MMRSAFLRAKVWSCSLTAKREEVKICTCILRAQRFECLARGRAHSPHPTPATRTRANAIGYIASGAVCVRSFSLTRSSLSCALHSPALTLLKDLLLGVFFFGNRRTNERYTSLAFFRLSSALQMLSRTLFVAMLICHGEICA